MKKNTIIIPPNALTKDDMRVLAGLLFSCGYSIHSKKLDDKYKNFKCIEFWRDDEQ